MTTLEEKQLETLAGVVDNESKTYTFQKEITVNGKKVKGMFKTKYMGIGARLRLGTLRAKLLDGAPAESVDMLTDDIAYMMAYLTVNLIETPTWWNYDDLEELEDLQSVYKEVEKFNNQFREKNAICGDAGVGSDTNGKKTVESI